MGWIRKIPPDHKCEVPERTEAGIGSVWECDTCARTWTLRFESIGNPPIWVHDHQEGNYYYGT